VLAVEAIKLLESPLRDICDRVWVVLAPRDRLVERLGARGMPEGEVLGRLRHQAAEDVFRAAADAVITNDGDRESTRGQVAEAWSRLRGRS
jgi:dephospho-CoA kinase